MYEIISGLFLGTIEDARSKPPEITAILNCTSEFPFYVGDEDADRISCMRISVRDNGCDNAKIAPQLDAAILFINTALNATPPGRILVHCAMGRQRSAAVIAAYLMQTSQMSIDDAVAFIKKKKPDAFFGSVNFRESLEIFASISIKSPE